MSGDAGPGEICLRWDDQRPCKGQGCPVLGARLLLLLLGKGSPPVLHPQFSKVYCLMNALCGCFGFFGFYFEGGVGRKGRITEGFKLCF